MTSEPRRALAVRPSDQAAPSVEFRQMGVFQQPTREVHMRGCFDGLCAVVVENVATGFVDSNIKAMLPELHILGVHADPA